MCARESHVCIVGKPLRSRRPTSLSPLRRSSQEHIISNSHTHTHTHTHIHTPWHSSQTSLVQDHCGAAVVCFEDVLSAELRSRSDGPHLCRLLKGLCVTLARTTVPPLDNLAEAEKEDTAAASDAAASDAAAPDGRQQVRGSRWLRWCIKSCTGPSHGCSSRRSAPGA